jgi:hypothetical protein
MPQTQFILSQVARIVNQKAHVVAYAISAGNLPEPKLRIAGKRIFSAQEVEAITKYFQNRQKKDKQEATNEPK